MPLIRHKGTGHTLTVPDEAVPYFPDYEVEGAAARPIPSHRGAGSGRDSWAAYADRHGVTIPDDAGRDEIIAALNEAGVPTE